MFSLLLGTALSFTCSPATGMTSQTDTSAKAWPCCCIQRMVYLTSTYPCPVVKFSETIQICLINQAEQFWEQFPNRHQNEKRNIFVKIFFMLSTTILCLPLPIKETTPSVFTVGKLICHLSGQISSVVTSFKNCNKKDNFQMTARKKRQLSLLRETQRQCRLKERET